MDPLTQGLLGGVVARSFMPHKERRVALVAGMLGGMAADLDIVIRSASDPLMGVLHHRGFTHSLAFVPVGGLLVGTFVWLVMRRRLGWRSVTLAATLGYVTHGLLDATTSYGTQLLWPFSNFRAAWDIAPIIEPVFTLILLTGFVAGFFQSVPRASRIAAILAAAWMGVMVLQHQRAIDLQHQLAAERGHQIERGRVFPTLANLVLWRGVYEHQGQLYSDTIRIGFLGDARSWHRGALAHVPVEQILPPDSTGSVLARDLDIFYWFADGYLARHREKPNVLIDHRYSLMPHGDIPMWGVQLPGNPSQHIRRVMFRNVEQMDFAGFWQYVTGNLEEEHLAFRKISD